MKQHPTILSLSAAILLGCTVGGAPLAYAEEQKPKGWGTQFLENMKKWEDKMSDVFRDTLKKKEGDKSAYSASVDVREQSDHYTVRVHLPNRDLSKVQVTMEGNALKIASDDGYQQSITLDNAATVAQPNVDRRDQTLVIKLPKKEGAVASSSKSSPPRSLIAPEPWEQDVLTRMEEMRREMDRVFDDAFNSFRLGVGGITYFDQPQFGSQIDLQDEKDRYVIRAYLPGRDVQKVDVKVQDQTLTIAAQAEQREKKEGEAAALESYAMSSYSQSLALPGPVKADKMEVERKEGLLVITLPKGGV